MVKRTKQVVKPQIKRDTHNSSSAEIGVVLVHGAGLDVWIWNDLQPLVEAPTLPVALPARDASQTVRDGLRLQDYTDSIIEQIDAWDVSRVVLVGHSIGGALCMEVASSLTNRYEGFIGLSAAIPKPERSFLSYLPLYKRLLTQGILRFTGTRPPRSLIRWSLCEKLINERARRVVAGFSPESRHLFTDTRSGGIPEGQSRYIQTKMDRVLTKGLQTKMATTLGTDDTVTLETGHLPMLSRPDELASALNEFSARIQ